MKQVIATITRNEQILPSLTRPHTRTILGSHLMRLHCPEIAAEARPGQFVMVRCPDEVGILPRPFSVHEATADDITLFFAVLEGGKGTNWLSRRQDNDEVELFGPLGNGFSINPGARNLLLVAGGIGIAPLSFLAKVAASQGCAVKLHEAVDTASQISLDALHSHYEFVLPRTPSSSMPAEATQYASAGTIAYTANTADGSAFIRGLATVSVPGLAAGADQIFACGPMAMYKAMAQMTEIREKSVQVSLEMVMGCGRGICYGCTIKTKNGLREVCTDGPVFDLDDILWGELGI